MSEYDSSINYHRLYKFVHSRYKSLNPYQRIYGYNLTTSISYYPNTPTIFSKGNFFYIDERKHNCLYQIDDKGNIEVYIHKFKEYYVNIQGTDYRDPYIVYCSFLIDYILDVSDFDNIMIKEIPHKIEHIFYKFYDNGIIYKTNTREKLMVEFNGHRTFTIPYHVTNLSSNRQYLFSYSTKHINVYDLDGQLISSIVFEPKPFKHIIYLEEDYFLTPDSYIYKYTPEGFIKCIHYSGTQMNICIRNNMLIYPGPDGYYILDLLTNEKQLIVCYDYFNKVTSNANGTALLDEKPKLYNTSKSK